MSSIHRSLSITLVTIAFLALEGGDSGSGGGGSPAVDVSAISCGAGDLGDYVECVDYGKCYGKMCADQGSGAVQDACVGVGGELAIGTQLGPACNGGDEAAIRLACETGTAQLIAAGTECAAPGGGGGEDTVAGEDTVEVDPSSCEGPCENHMEGECLGTDYGCRCEFVDNEFGQAELTWVLSNCVEGAYADMCVNDQSGTPMCKPSDDGTSAACACEM